MQSDAELADLRKRVLQFIQDATPAHAEAHGTRFCGSLPMEDCARLLKDFVLTNYLRYALPHIRRSRVAADTRRSPRVHSGYAEHVSRARPCGRAQSASTGSEPLP